MYIVLLVLLGLSRVHLGDCSQCACATTNVHVRDGAGTTHTILTTLVTGHCLTFKDHRQIVSGAYWVNVNYNEQDGWIHERYVNIADCPSSVNHTNSQLQLPGCPKIITRAEWGALAPYPTLEKLHLPVKYVFIHHGATDFCHTKDECIQRVKSYQHVYVDGHERADTGYNFVVGEDGNVYEARGWDDVGVHTYGYNSVGLAICVIGDFTYRVPNDAALNAVEQLIYCGAVNGKLSSSYLLRGHRDMEATSCPGDKLYDLIQTWPHY